MTAHLPSRLKQYIILILISITIYSCMKDEIDLSNINDRIEINPQLSVPVAYGKLTLLDILPDNDTLIVLHGPNNDSIKIILNQDSITTYYMTEFFTIPEQDLFVRSFDFGNLDVNDFDFTHSISLGDMAQNMGDPEGSAIEAADGTTGPFPAVPSQSLGSHTLNPIPGFNFLQLAEGTLSMTITNNLQITISSITINLRNSSDNSLIGTFSFTNIPPGGQQTESIDLAGRTLRNPLAAEIAEFSSPGAPNVPINLNDDLVLRLQSSNLRASRGDAILPSQVLQQDTTDFELQMSSDEEIDLIELSDGRIDISLNSYFADNVEFVINLPNTTIGGVPVVETIPITGSGNSTGSVNLSNSVTVLEDINLIPVIFELRSQSSGQPVQFDFGDSVSYNSQMNFTNINISYIEGYLGQHTDILEEDTFKISEREDMEIMDKISGTFTLTNPLLSIYYKNTMGLPINMDILLTGLFDDGPRDLDIAPQSLNVPNDRYSPPAEGTIYVNRYNSEGITDFLTFPPPENYLYNGVARTNIEGDIGNTDFLCADSKVIMGIEAELPLELKSSGVILQDTIVFGVGENIDKEMMEFATLHYSIRNAFPLDIDMEFILYDSINEIKYDTLTFSDIAFAPVDADGIVMENYLGRAQGTIELDESATYNLMNNTNKAIIKARMNTAMRSGEYEPVKMLTWYYIDFAFGIEAKLKLSP